MKILRWITISFLLLLFVATVTIWIWSYWKAHVILFGGNSYVQLGAVDGKCVLGMGDSPIPLSGFNYFAVDITPALLASINSRLTFGFAIITEARGWGLFLPFWILALLEGGLAGFLIWRAVLARRRRQAPAFPVEAIGGNE